MLLRDKIAGILVAFGIIGLAAAPLLGTASAKDTRPAVDTVSIAITTGPHLKLLQKSDTVQRMATLPVERNAVCKRVIRLDIADIGLGCDIIPASRNLALARQR